MIEIAILFAVLAAASVAGLLVRARQGRVRATDIRTPVPERDQLLAAAGVTGSTPAVLHFSAEWCGPCAAVRRVVANVTTELADSANAPRDIEVDIDAEPALARTLNVLSLPTTFVFDSDGKERFRISGVPKAADLRTALEPLTV